MPGVYDFTAHSLAGEQIPLKRFEGQVLLIVNTASACGFTPQYKGLEQLQRELSPRGFSVLGFPCNQFGAQEPDSEKQIAEFCETSFGVTFPMFAKIDVNGANAHPLYKYLTSEKAGVLGTEAIKWNFTKFLIDSSGQPVARYGSSTKPETLEAPIQKLL
jgi:glutathione peroxidase